MTEGPIVHVHAKKLDEAAPVAIRDSVEHLHLFIDFDQPSDVLAAALEGLVQEAIDSGRWTRRRPTGSEPG